MARREKKIDKRFKSGKRIMYEDRNKSMAHHEREREREGERVIGVRCPNGESG